MFGSANLQANTNTKVRLRITPPKSETLAALQKHLLSANHCDRSGRQTEREKEHEKQFETIRNNLEIIGGS